MVKAAPSASLVVTEPDLLLEFLIVSFDAPAQLGKIDELAEADLRRQRRQPVFGCKSWNLILQFALRRGGCPTKSCVRRYAAGSNFSLAMGSASRKVCIGVLP